MSANVWSSSNRYPTDLLRQRAHDAAKHRRLLRHQVGGGFMTFGQLLALIPHDRIVGRTRVKTALSWLPSIGPIKTRLILSETQVAATQRLCSLTHSQRLRLQQHPQVMKHAELVRLQRGTGDIA